MMVKPLWWDWITRDENGYRNGIRDDAPEEMKKAYAEFLKEYEKTDKMGRRIKL